MSSLFSLIKENKIKTPTQKGFSIKKWNKCWDDIKINACDKDKKIYRAGVVIFGLLEEIRKELNTLYKDRVPNLTNSQLLIAYLSLSNRDRCVMSRKGMESVVNVHSLRTADTVFGNELTYEEVSHGAVDGVEKAIFFCKNRIKNSQDLKSGDDPLDEVEFILRESYLSQLYDAYENYWHAILWSDYSFYEVDEKRSIYLIEQPMDKFEIGWCVSQNRKSKLSAQSAHIAGSPSIRQYFDKDRYVSSLKNGRKRKLGCLSIRNADDEIKHINSDWQTQIEFLSDSFNPDLLQNDFDNGFSVYDLLEVFRNLVLLSAVFLRNYPEDDSFFNFKKLSEFCPKVNKNELRSALKKSTDFGIEKINRILDFVEYKGIEKQDLWCHPIVSLSSGHYIFSTAALITPVIMRLVEHWLVGLGVELQEKGSWYERMIIDGVNEAIEGNAIISDFDKAVSCRVKIGGSEEEIDLVVRVGNLVLIGEAKSIVTTDSPISYYRTIQTLKRAAVQVKRKAKFVKDNLEYVFDRLNWIFDRDKEYVFQECILNSGRMYVGFDMDGVPVCDEKILVRYFSDNEIPIMSVFDHDINDVKNLAWFELYNNIDELKSNLSKYLNHPPQVLEDKRNFEYKEISVPSLFESSYNILYKRLVSVDFSIEDILRKDQYFKFKKSDEFEKEINNIDFIF